jgi:CheY-like chemotaxis protein
MSSSTSNTPYALVVDDDDHVRMLACDILEDAGFRTLDAATGDDAIGILREHGDEIVLLFSDVEMPGRLDGFALARETARLWPGISIVVASGRRSPEPGEMPEHARFLSKPFSAQMVYDHLKEILPDGRKPEPLRS